MLREMDQYEGKDYTRQVDALRRFYRAHDPAKGEVSCRAIIDKRRHNAAALSTAVWIDLCMRLAEKYGHNTISTSYSSGSHGQSHPDDCVLPAQAEIRVQSNGQQRHKNHTHILSLFYGNHVLKCPAAEILLRRKEGALALYDSGRGGFLHLCQKLAQRFRDDPIRVSSEADHFFCHVEFGAALKCRSARLDAPASASVSASFRGVAASRSAVDCALRNPAMYSFNRITVLQGALRHARMGGIADLEHLLHRLEWRYCWCTRENEDIITHCVQQRRQFDLKIERWVIKNKSLAREHRAANNELASAKQAVLRQQSAVVENHRLTRAAEQSCAEIRAQEKELQELMERFALLNEQKIRVQDDLHRTNAKLQRYVRGATDAKEEAKLAQRQTTSAQLAMMRLIDAMVQMRQEIAAQHSSLHQQLKKFKPGQALDCLGTLQNPDDAMLELENERIGMAAHINKLEMQCASLKAALEDRLHDHVVFSQLYNESQQDSQLQVAELQACLSAKTDAYNSINEIRLYEKGEAKSQVENLNCQLAQRRHELARLAVEFDNEVKGLGDATKQFGTVFQNGAVPNRHVDVTDLPPAAALAEQYDGAPVDALTKRSDEMQGETQRLQIALKQLEAQLYAPATCMYKSLATEEAMAHKFNQLAASLYKTSGQNAELRNQLHVVGRSEENLTKNVHLLEQETDLLRKHVGQLMSTPFQTGSNNNGKRRRGSRGHMALSKPADARETQNTELRNDTEIPQMHLIHKERGSIFPGPGQNTAQTQLDQCSAERSANCKLWQWQRNALQMVAHQRDTFMHALKAEMGQQVARQCRTERHTFEGSESAELQRGSESAELQRLTTAYQSSNSNWQERLDNLRNMVQSSTERARQAELALSQKHIELEEANFLSYNLHQSNASASKYAKRLQTDCERNEAAVRSLCLRLSTLEAELNTSQSESSRKSFVLASLKGQTLSLRSREEQLQFSYSDMAQAQREVSMALSNLLAATQLEKQLQRKDRAALQVKLRTAAELTANIGSRFRYEHQAHEASSAALATASDARHNAEAVILNMRASQHGLRQLCSSLSKTVHGDSGEARQIFSDAGTARSSCKRVKNLSTHCAVSNTSAQLSAARDEIISLRQHVEELRRLLQSKEQQISGLQRTAQSHDGKLIRVEQKLSTSVSREQKLHEELRRVRATVECAAASKRATEQKLLCLKMEKIQSRQAVQRLQVLLHAKEAAVTASEKQVTVLKQSEASARTEVARLDALEAHVTTARAETSAAHVCLVVTESAGHDKLLAVQNELDMTTAKLLQLRTENQCLAQRLAQALDAVQGGAVATSAIVIEGLRDTAKRLQGAREAAEAKLVLAQQDAMHYRSQTQLLQTKLSTCQHWETASNRNLEVVKIAHGRLEEDKKAAYQTIDMADETRASRDRLAIQLEESDRAKIKAEAGEAAAIAKHKEIERQNCCMEGMLTASRQEAQMWRTKLNTSTERAKLQKLQKELGVQGLEMLEVEKRCADRLKLAQQWKHKQGHNEKELQGLKVVHGTVILELQAKIQQLKAETVSLLEKGAVSRQCDQLQRQRLEHDYQQVMEERDKLKLEKEKAVELVKKLMKKLSTAV